MIPYNQFFRVLYRMARYIQYEVQTTVLSVQTELNAGILCSQPARRERQKQSYPGSHQHPIPRRRSCRSPTLQHEIPEARYELTVL